MKYFNKKYGGVGQWTVAIAIFITGLGLFVNNTWPRLMSPMQSTGNAYSRLITIMLYVSGKEIVNDYVWLPLYPKIIGILTIAIGNIVEFYPRLVTWTMYWLLAVAVGFLVYILTKRVETALIGIGFFLINPLTISLSTVTLSENLWILLVLLSLIFILKSGRLLIIGVILWVISEMVRYESWMFSPLLLFIFWFKHKSLKALIILAISIVVYPLLNLLETNYYTGSFLSYIEVKKFYAMTGPEEVYGNLMASFNVWKEVLTSVVSTPMILLFLAYIYKQLKAGIMLWLIPVICFVSLVVQVYLGTMEYFPARYLAIVPALVYPLVVAMVFQNSIVNKYKYKVMGLMLIFLLEIYNLPANLEKIDEKPIKSAVEVGEYMKRELTDDTKVVYVREDFGDTTWTDSQVWYFSNVALDKYSWSSIEEMNKDNFDSLNEKVMFVVEKGDDWKINERLETERLGNMSYENLQFVVFIKESIKKKG